MIEQAFPGINPETSPHPEKTRRALTYLHDLQAHFVLLVSTGDGKKPLWSGYMRWRLALEHVLHHGDGLGIIPWSIQTTALDVDAGEPFQLSLFHHPVVVLASRRGEHLYYRDIEARRKRDFSLHDASGQIIGATAFLKLWHADGPVKLLHGLTYNDDPCLFPADVLLSQPTKYRPPADPGEPYTRRVSVPDIDLSKIGRYSRKRNTSLFNVVRCWAYREPKPATATAWDAAVRIYANTRNIEFPAPLKVHEVERLALSISSWVWSGGGPSGHRIWTPEQRSRGGQTWARMQQFDSLKKHTLVRAMAARGERQRVIAEHVGLSQARVSQILRREAKI